MANNATLPSGDSTYTAEQTTSLGDLLNDSPMAKYFEAPPQPDEEVPAPTEGEDIPNSPGDGNATEDNPEDTPPEDTETDGDETPPEDSVNTEDSIDWSYKVPVKVDGKEEHLTLEELRKGYATAKHLSTEGRKLGELRKEIEQEREVKLQEVINLGTLLHSQLTADEEALTKEYHTIKAEMEAAVEEGDGYTAKELKSKLTQVQKNYWDKKNAKESLEQQVGSQLAEAKERETLAKVQYFQENIGKFMPDYNQDKANQLREFALKEGIPQSVLSEVYEPAVLKMLNDYMTLKNKTSTGAQKREVAPKTIPVKKSTPMKAQAQQQKESLRARALSEEGTRADSRAYLTSILGDRFNK